jgi:hypothetical protein
VGNISAKLSQQHQAACQEQRNQKGKQDGIAMPLNPLQAILPKAGNTGLKIGIRQCLHGADLA